jgi:hypothetical protein
MTSTIFSPYVDHVMEESRTAYFSESPGAIPDTNNGGLSKTVGVARLGRMLNDLLPYSLRPIKARRRRARVWHGVRVELFTMKMRWHGSGKYKMRKRIATLLKK